MPVIGIPVDLLLERVKTQPGRQELVEHLQHLGCDVEGYATMRRFACGRCGNLMEITETENPPVVCDRCGTDFKSSPEQLSAAGEKDVVRMELLAVRPDMFDPGGLARTLRNYFKETLDSPGYPSKASEYVVTVEEGLEQRPYIACAVVRNLKLDDDKIRVIMKLQENLHWALGRDRKRASIGVYDLDTLQGKQFRYTSVGPEEIEFAPLGYSAGEKWTPARVLKEHTKGTAYARLIQNHPRYPILLDEGQQVMALIPIINSESTKVSKNSTNFFIDVTGLEERIVNKTLNTIVTSMLELDPGAGLETVKIASGPNAHNTPDLTPQPAILNPKTAASRLGVPLDRDGVSECLRRMGHEVHERPDGNLDVKVPAYRNDILHEVDLIEDVAIAYGYHNIVPTLVPTLTVGAEQPLEIAAQAARASLTGLGYLEVLTLILSNEAAQYDFLGRPRQNKHVVIQLPISQDQTMVRVSLLPGLLDTLSVNTDHELPQRIFEVGNISLLDESETGASEHRRLAAAAIGPRVDFAGMRATCEALLREFGYRLETRASLDPVFLPGRGAEVWGHRGEQAVHLGLLGEIHPQWLEHYGLGHPAAAFELDFAALGSC
ncbi:MAG: phenylalanine--tRNA ligase subunit beta [Candidatus Eremiobacteraeota bacterium]|nr:phenylalanine--tRNA ligase subunit beta [Candidatus Eremiobacteraeota bacterium]MCW5868080.1 phenylalanine--tRNA ligase subunit beta [Candidatus Eremiobacteraeota bacterium]